MHSSSRLLSLSVLALAAASPLESHVYAEDGVQGFRLPLTKKDLVPIEKRGVTASVPINMRWWLTLGIGMPPQDVNFLPDTGAHAFTIQSTLMPANETGDAPLYDPSKSTTVNTKIYKGARYRELGFEGPLYTETITVGSQVFSNVTVAVWDTAPQREFGDRNGNLGMGPQRTFNGGPNDPPEFMQAIKSQLSQNVATFTFNPYLLQGEMDLGFIDTSKYTGTLAWATPPPAQFWFVNVTGLLDSNGKLVSSVPKFRALLDHGGVISTLPRTALDWYFKQVSGAVFNNGSQTYRYPCDANLPDFVFSIGSAAIRLPKASWRGSNLNSSVNICQPKFTVGPSDSVYFGTAFLEGVFAAFDYDNFRIGLANRPAPQNNVPALPNVGNTKFCTGPNFSGSCMTAGWPTNTCKSLAGTPYYNKVGSFSPSAGYCTLYNDTACAQPITTAQAVRSPGQSDTGSNANKIGSYTCFYPNDYPSQRRQSPPFDEIQFDSTPYYSGQAFYEWLPFACYNLNPSLAKNVSAIGPSTGYCYLFTNPNCTGAIQNGAPFVYPGREYLSFGLQAQSWMCV